MKKNTSWGPVARWYDELLDDVDSYQTKIILPGIIRLLGPIKDRKILDLACGQGFFSHALAKEGAKVTAVDISPELITIAKEKAAGGEQFHVSAADNLSLFENEKFDAVLCVLAIQNIENMARTFHEVGRVLVPKGRFVMVVNHPCFRVPGGSFWQFDEEKKLQYRRIDSYMSELKKEINMHPGISGGEATVSFHRPLQVYAKSLSKAGLIISRMEEWISHKKSQKGSRQHAENRARKEFPLFMCIECIKSHF